MNKVKHLKHCIKIAHNLHKVPSVCWLFNYKVQSISSKFNLPCYKETKPETNMQTAMLEQQNNRNIISMYIITLINQNVLLSFFF